MVMTVNVRRLPNAKPTGRGMARYFKSSPMTRVVCSPVAVTV
jgi:hypothetical protein